MVINDSQANAILNLILGSQAYAPAATVYIGLVTDDPNADGTGYTEVAGGSYARVAKTNNNTNFPDVTTPREKTNGTEILFPQASANWGAVVGVCVFAGNAGGAALLYAPFAAPETININNTPSFAPGQLKFRIAA